VYVFHLRKGVKFHDGSDFDAEAVRWNYQRTMDPEEKAFDAPYYSIVEAVEVIDRPIYLRRLTRDRDWEQSLIFTGAALDAYSISRALDTRAGNNTLNHQTRT
jgi:glutathione transport system substrate-binding protein